MGDMKTPKRSLTASWAGLSLALALCGNASAQLFSERFSYPDGLITDEHAFSAPASLDAKKSAYWEVTAGALFARGSEASTGGPALLRMRTARRDFADAAVSFRVLNRGLASSPDTPARDWDGLHLRLRQQDERSFYHIGVNRRDGTCDIKKRVPSGGGAYHNLVAGVARSVPYGSWQSVRALTRTRADGSVSIELYMDGALVVSAIDDGTVGGAPLREPGAIGIRGDNADLSFDDFSVIPAARGENHETHAARLP